jgi:hypothetical protein
MKQWAIVILTLGLAAGVPISAEEWTDITPDASMDGWVQRNGEAKFTVEDGVVIGTSVPNTPNSFLCTEKEYRNFILEFEFMGHPELNSGVQIRSESKPGYKDGRVHGYQVELEQEGRDRDWSGGIYDEGRRGWLDPMKGDTEAEKAFGESGVTIWKNGEWNKVRVEAKGDRIRTWVNGEPRADLTDDMTPKGFIGLQVHGVGNKTEPMTVKWRNIRIQELPE